MSNGLVAKRNTLLATLSSETLGSGGGGISWETYLETEIPSALKDLQARTRGGLFDVAFVHGSFPANPRQLWDYDNTRILALRVKVEILPRGDELGDAL